MLPRDRKGPTGDQEDEQGGWSEVRRRGKQSQNGNTNGGIVTSFYVSNLPEGITKQKIKFVFTQFRRVVDIYIGGKRDRACLIFAFVRFVNVEDPKAMEQAMYKVRCEHSILKVNIARYHKQSNVPKQITIEQERNLGTQTNHPDPMQRQLLMNKLGRPHSTLPYPSRRAAFSKDLDKCVMVGEPISLQHIAELPNILPLDVNPTGKVHYIGGTNILIKFPNTVAAKAFYDNEHNWNRWFKWLKLCFNDDLPQERLAWVTILALPIRFRDWKPYDQPAPVEPEIEEEEEDDDMSDDNFDDAGDEEFVDDTDSDGDVQCQKDDTIEDGEIVKEPNESNALATVPMIDRQR
ncbi:hypothetical protein LXL04_024523 [Taraxacum kok-saghyz]